jgi:putative ABC transport system permease protein
MNLLPDIRYGARLMRRRPGFAAICVLTLAVGIGLTTMMFSIVNAALIKGLPFEEPDRLVGVYQTDVVQDFDFVWPSILDFAEWREQQQAFEALAGYGTGTFNVTGPDGAERYDGAWMTANAFDVVRARPVLGRTFAPGEDAPGSPAVVVLGFRVWQDRFGGDPGVLGGTLRINGEEATIIGVMGEGFMFPERQSLWLNERRDASLFQRGEPGVPSINAFARLRPGVSMDQANVQMQAIAARQRASYPETHENVGASVTAFTEQALGKEPRRLLYVMLGAVFGVLLIACVNVANLLLSQASLRAREVGIRSALGASRLRVIAQFLTEPLLLAGAASVLGLGIGWVGLRLFVRAVEPTEPPYWIDFSMDGTVLLFVLAVTLFATLVSGVLPAIRASGGNVNEILKDESRGGSSQRGGKLTRALVVAEIALSVVLLAGAGLMIKSVANLRAVDYAFATDDVLTARLGLPEADAAYADVASRVRFFEEVESRLAAEPGVRAVALTTALPGSGTGRPRVAVDGRAYERTSDLPLARAATVSPAFFDALDAPVVDGRAFDARDGAESLPVAIVNETFARKHFPEGDALGSRIRSGGVDSEEPWLTVVGIAPDLHMSGIENEDPEGFYTPLAQSSTVRFMSITVRGAGAPTALTPQVRRAVAAVNPDIPIYWVRTLDEVIARNAWFYRVFGTIFMLMGFVALFLAAIGLYGVMSFSVSRRTREVGVRMALGAQAEHVVRLIVRQGLVQLAVGLVVGLAGALAVTSLLRGFLFGVSPRDPVTFVWIVAVLVVTGAVASLVPARRATRVDPLIAIRYE